MVAVVVVFVLLIITTVSCAICAKVRGGRLQNVHRGTAAANSNFPATILTSSGAGSSSNFSYAPIPQEPPPPYPGTPTDGEFSDFVSAPQIQQSQAQQQPVSSSSHEHTTHENPPPTTQEALPYGTSTNAPFYPEPLAAESDHEFEGAAETSDTAPLLNPTVSDSDNNNIAVQSLAHYEAEPLPDVAAAAELPAEVDVDDPPPSDEPPPFPLTELEYPPTDDGVVSYPTATDDSDIMNSQAPPSNKDY